MLDLSGIESSPIDDGTKGMPGGLPPTALRDIGRQICADPAFDFYSLADSLSAVGQSRPEPTQAIFTIGRRDVGTDAGLPVPLRWLRPPGRAADVQPLGAGHEVTSLNDQHCIMRVPADTPLAFGDMVVFGVSHPCTTFDKWQVLCVVDAAYDLVDAVRTFF